MSQAQVFLADFEGFLDTALTEGRKTDIAKIMPQYNLKAADVEVIEKKLQPRADEMELVVLNADYELIEGWKDVPKSTQKAILEMYFDALEFKVARKERTKKVVSEKVENGAMVERTKKAEKAPKVQKAAKEKKDTKLTFDGTPATLIRVLDIYKTLQVFEGAIQNGNSIKSERSYEVILPKDFNYDVFDNMTVAEFIELRDERGISKEHGPSVRSAKRSDRKIITLK